MAIALNNSVRQLIRRRPAILVAVALVVLVVLWMGSGAIGSGDPVDSSPAGAGASDQAASIGPLFPVAVISSEAIERPARLVINGRTEPFRTVEIRAEIEGRLIELDTYRGNSVADGYIVAKIALYDRQAKLAEARALLRQREVEYAASRSLVEQEYRSETQHAAARAQLDAARAVVEQMLSNVERTNIRAPFDGVIHGGHAELGDYVKSGDIVATILDLDPILVVGHATEMEVAALTLNGKGAAQFIDGTIVEGTITYIAPSADATTRTYRYEIEVPNPDYAVRAGLTAKTLIDAGATIAHHISASSLTLSDAGEIGVKTVDEEDIVRFFAVQIIEDDTAGMWVVGLPQAIRIISTGHEFVSEGQQVRPIEEETQASDDEARMGPDAIAEQPTPELEPASDQGASQ